MSGMTEKDRTDRYRWLLATYPRGYRKQRAAEILGTVLDAADSGHRPGTTRLAVNLWAGGLRARLGRPRSRLVVVFSILTALMVGLLGSALGYRLAWQTTGDLPSTAAARRAAVTATSQDVVWTQRNDFVMGFDGYGRLSLLKELAYWPIATDLPGLPDSDLYGPGYVDAWTAQRTSATVASTAADAKRRLRADGWEIGCFPSEDSCRHADPAEFVARKGDVVLQVALERGRTTKAQDPADATWITSPNGPMVAIDVASYRAVPPLVPLGWLVSGLLFAALGWLAFGWFSRRTEGSVGAVVAYGFLTAIMLPPAIQAARAVWSFVTAGTPDTGGWGSPWLPSSAPINAILDWNTLLDVIAGPALLTLLILALLPRRTTSAQDPVAG